MSSSARPLDAFPFVRICNIEKLQASLAGSPERHRVGISNNE